MKKYNDLPESVKIKMEADRKLASDENVKCHYCGDNCKSTYMGVKTCSKCMPHDCQKTAMTELKEKLLEVYQKEKESSFNSDFLKGYRDCLKNIANDIDAQMNEIEVKKTILFAEYLATHFVPTSQNGVLQYWQQKNYQGKLKFTTDEVYRVYAAEPTQIAQTIN